MKFIEPKISIRLLSTATWSSAAEALESHPLGVFRRVYFERLKCETDIDGHAENCVLKEQDEVVTSELRCVVDAGNEL